MVPPQSQKLNPKSVCTGQEHRHQTARSPQPYPGGFRVNKKPEKALPNLQGRGRCLHFAGSQHAARTAAPRCRADRRDPDVCLPWPSHACTSPGLASGPHFSVRPVRPCRPKPSLFSIRNQTVRFFYTMFLYTTNYSRVLNPFLRKSCLILANKS